MTEEPAQPAVTPQVTAEEESLGDVIARVIADGRAYTAAEGERQKLRAGIVGAGVRDAAIFGAIALMLVFAAIVALLIGLIIALAPLLGPILATLAVFGGAVAVAIILLFLAKLRVGRMTKAIRP